MSISSSASCKAGSSVVRQRPDAGRARARQEDVLNDASGCHRGFEPGGRNLGGRTRRCRDRCPGGSRGALRLCDGRRRARRRRAGARGRAQPAACRARVDPGDCVPGQCLRGAGHGAGRSGAKGKESITIIWVVLAPDGTQLGVTRQTKDVSKGTLDKKWGPPPTPRQRQRLRTSPSSSPNRLVRGSLRRHLYSIAPHPLICREEG